MTTALALPPDQLASNNLRATETALELDADLTYEQWEEIGHTLGRANRASAWWIGDWINYGEARWGEKYNEARRITGLAYDTLQRYAQVASRFAIPDRIRNLSFPHHQIVAPIEDAAERREWLERAIDEGWGKDKLRQALIPERPRVAISQQHRHASLIETAAQLVRIGERWERPMTDVLSPPQARKQLTVLRKAQVLLTEVTAAVEYRADTLATFRR